MQKIKIASILASALLLAGCGETADTVNPPLVEPTPATPAMDNATPAPVAANMIVYKDGAFSPAMLTVKMGEEVTIQNGDTSAMRVSSNPHPAHTSNPSFDSGILAAGKAWKVKVQKSTKFHNHLNPSAMGEIVVK